MVHKTSFQLLAASLVILTAGIAYAGGAPDASGSFWDNWGFVISHAVNFAILLGLLIKFAGPKVIEGLQNRSASISREIEEASRLHQEAQAMLEQCESQVAGLEVQTETLLSDYRRLGEMERDRLVAEGSAEAERIRTEAQQVARNELSRARARLEAEVVDRAIEAAGEAIRDELGEDDHHRLTTEYFASLESSLRS